MDKASAFEQQRLIPAGVTSIAPAVQAGAAMMPASLSTSMPPSMATHGAVAYERLAPGGAGYLPTTYLSSSQAAGMQTYAPGTAYTPGVNYSAGQTYYSAKPPPTAPTVLQQTYPSNVPLSTTYPPPSGYASYAMPQGYYMPPPPTAGSNATEHTDKHATKRTPIHAPGEPTGELPKFLPDKFATALGYEAAKPGKPTLGACEVEGDMVTIRASGAPRWRLELKDAGWGAPIDAIADTKSAVFRLHKACERTLTVRVCPLPPPLGQLLPQPMHGHLT